MKIYRLVGAVFGTIIKITIIVAAVLFIYKGALTGYDFGYRVFKQEPVALGEGRTVQVTVTEDMSVKAIGELFLKHGLIKDKLLFTAQYYLSEFREDVKPGTFELSTAMTVEEMMEIMATEVLEEKEASK